MFLENLRDHYQDFPTQARILCVDHGAKTLGLAMSDAAQGVATPYKTLPRRKMKQDVVDFKEVIADYQIGAILFGYPLDKYGQPGPRAQSVRDYARALGDQLPDQMIALWDERLSTAAVDKFMINIVDMSRTKRKQNVDKLAAQFILQGALDFLSMVRSKEK